MTITTQPFGTRRAAGMAPLSERMPAVKCTALAEPGFAGRGRVRRAAASRPDRAWPGAQA